MSDAILEKVASQIIQSGYWRQSSVVLWHAGEPMSLGWQWYKRAHDIIDGGSGRVNRIQFQTNATLLNDKWIDFLLETKASVGISIDGPKWLHDLHRKDRAGNGTFDIVMRGAERLRQAKIPFTNIATVTRDALKCADEVYNFFEGIRPEKLAFSIEEAEGANARSSLYEDAVLADVAAFFRRIAQRSFTSRTPLRIREIESVLASMLAPPGQVCTSQETQMGRIVAVGRTGDVAIFSPELLTTIRPDGGYATVGNITTQSLRDIYASDAARQQHAQILAGVDLCEQTCKLFAQCGGGSPANKLFEAHRYDISETWYCRVAKQATVRGIMDAIDEAGGLP